MMVWMAAEMEASGDHEVRVFRCSCDWNLEICATRVRGAEGDDGRR